MSDSVAVSPQALSNRVDWMRAIAGELAGAGLAAGVRETFAWLDLTVSPATRQPRHKDPEASLDADGYVEIRWWNDPTTPPADVAARISRVLAAAHLTTAFGPDDTQR